MAKKAFFGNLASGVQEDNLKDFLENNLPGLGPVIVKVLKDPAGLKPKFGFVTFIAEADYARALKFINGREFLGRKLIVAPARETKHAAR